jgi:hypothetical protein
MHDYGTLEEFLLLILDLRVIDLENLSEARGLFQGLPVLGMLHLLFDGCLGIFAS